MKYLLILVFLFLTACDSDSSPQIAADAAAAAGATGEAVAVTIEGKPLGLESIDWAGSKSRVTQDSISVDLSAKDSPLKLSLEVLDDGILADGSATYMLPLVNKDGMSVDLSLIDSTRPGLAMKQRVLFTEGSIEIKSVTANSLAMVFDGSGHALMDNKKFPIKGSVNITF